MEYTSVKEEKIRDIKLAFAGVIGKRLTHYQTLDLYVEGDGFERCDDLPIILFFDEVDPVSISWTKTEDLAVCFGICLPYGIGGMTTRWMQDDIPELKPMSGKHLHAVYLTGEPAEYADRVVLKFDNGFLHIFNAGDENGYLFSEAAPGSELIFCI